VQDAGIVDFGSVCQALHREVEKNGGKVVLNSPVKRIQRWQSKWRVETDVRVWEADAVVNCAGIYSDRVLQASGLKRNIRLIPFRGEYFKLRSTAAAYCRHLVYPVPDPTLPFLGVHFTRTPDGEVEVGPNAVLAFGREGYSFESGNLRDLGDTLSYGGFWRMARTHWDSGIRELKQSLSKRLFIKAASSLIPEITLADLGEQRSGIRAQAVAPDGSLVDDFVFRQEGTLLHVINAPSPGATASLAIGEYVANQLARALGKAARSSQSGEIGW
jgi:L-2-hydroxyglutarate oxidase